MQTQDIFALGLGLQPPWTVVDQHLDTTTKPFTLHLRLGGTRGSLYPCPECGKLCKAHDFQEMRWRHLDFFQHHCYLTAKVPRIVCPEHGLGKVHVPWARPSSGFTLLFEHVILSLAREMPVIKIAKLVGTTDKRLWRVLQHYVFEALNRLDLSTVNAIALDETASKRGQQYVTVFVDMERDERPVLFATPGKGKECLREFSRFLENHNGSVDNILEIVCDMSAAFTRGAEEVFPYSRVTVDWFHVVKLFTDAVDSVRRLEAKHEQMPHGSRFAVLKNSTTPKTARQEAALQELAERGLYTATAYRVKELLRWVRQTDTAVKARWQLEIFCKYVRQITEDVPLLRPIEKAVATVEKHLNGIVRRWTSLFSNARLEGMNGLFQLARSRARGYRNPATFCLMIYLIGAPIGDILCG